MDCFGLFRALGFSVWGLGFGVWGLEFGFQGLGFKEVQSGLESREFRVRELTPTRIRFNNIQTLNPTLTPQTRPGIEIIRTSGPL